MTHDSIDKAAKSIGVTRNTLYRYMKDPLFDKELRAAKRQMVNRAIMRLQQSCGDATRALAQICRDKDAPASARVAAAREILGNALKAIEIEEIEDRLEALEKRLLNK